MASQQPPPYTASAPPPYQAKVATSAPPAPVHHPSPAFVRQTPVRTGPVVRTTVVTCTATTPLVGFHQYPVATRCRFCQQQVVTQVTHENGLLNWLTCGGLALLGIVCGCCLIPFCVKDLKDVVHSCPNCQIELGKYRRIS